MLYLTVNQCLIVMAFLVPLLVWLASRPINETINLPSDKDKEQQDKRGNELYGAYIQSQGRYYN